MLQLAMTLFLGKFRTVGYSVHAGCLGALINEDPILWRVRHQTCCQVHGVAQHCILHAFANREPWVTQRFLGVGLPQHTVQNHHKMYAPKLKLIMPFPVKMNAFLFTDLSFWPKFSTPCRAFSPPLQRKLHPRYVPRCHTPRSTPVRWRHHTGQ